MPTWNWNVWKARRGTTNIQLVNRTIDQGSAIDVKWSTEAEEGFDRSKFTCFARRAESNMSDFTIVDDVEAE